VAALKYLWQGFGDQASQEADVTAPQIPVEDTRAWTVASSSKYADTASEYRRMFLATSRDPASMVRVKRFTDRLLAGRARYETAVSGTPVPWYMLGIVHGLETNFAFNRHLHNGDPLSARTVNVPKGRPVTGTPPFDWTTSARDVLTMTHWASEQDWSFPHLLYLAERYNGMGYRRRGVPSPYVWAGTDIYQKGKFSADGRFDAELKAQGMGVAAVLKELVARGVIDL
jgi:lysozyme family protein